MQENINYQLANEAQNGNTVRVEELLDDGADPNAEDGQFYWTALMHAASEGHIETARLLLDQGADPNIKKKDDGMTALMLTTMFGNTETINLLLDRGANPNIQNNEGKTALMAAAIYDESTETIKLLLDRGADPNIQDNHGWTALMCASGLLCRLDVMEMLILADNTDVDIKEEGGRTALDLLKQEHPNDFYQCLEKLIGALSRKEKTSPRNEKGTGFEFDI